MKNKLKTNRKKKKNMKSSNSITSYTRLKKIQSVSPRMNGIPNKHQTWTTSISGHMKNNK